jgi:hypothetical protein
LKIHPEMDVVYGGNGRPPPSLLLLDYTYGAAVYKHWGVGGEFKDLLDDYSAEHYGAALAQAPIPQQLSPAPSEPEHLSDPDWVPDRGTPPSENHDDELVDALDCFAELYYLLMGKTAKTIEAKIQRIPNETELRDRWANAKNGRPLWFVSLSYCLDLNAVNMVGLGVLIGFLC